MSISERIRDFLKLQNLTVADLSRDIGISHQSLSYAIRESGTPNSDIIAKISNKYKNLNIDWILNGEGEMFRNNKENASQFASTSNNFFIDMLAKKDEKIMELSQELGKLRYEVECLRKQIENNKEENINKGVAARAVELKKS